jgi:hypothetical protein
MVIQASDAEGGVNERDLGKKEVAKRESEWVF